MPTTLSEDFPILHNVRQSWRLRTDSKQQPSSATANDASTAVPPFATSVPCPTPVQPASALKVLVNGALLSSSTSHSQSSACPVLHFFSRAIVRPQTLPNPPPPLASPSPCANQGTATLQGHVRAPPGLNTCPPPPLCPTNALSNPQFCSDRIFLGPNSSGTGSGTA